MREHHIGIVVKKLEESQEIFEKLGYRVCSKVTIDEYQYNRILFLENEKSLQKVELIEALNEQSTVKNVKLGIHHICYEVGEVESFHEIFKEMNIGKIFTRNITAPALDNRYVVFACLKNGLFVEFVMEGGKMEELCIQIAEIIKSFIEDLNLDKKHYESDLTELGMNSISFIQTIVELEDKYQIEIPDEYLLLNNMSTVYKMASVVMSLKGTRQGKIGQE